MELMEVACNKGQARGHLFVVKAQAGMSSGDVGSTAIAGVGSSGGPEQGEDGVAVISPRYELEKYES